MGCGASAKDAEADKEAVVQNVDGGSAAPKAVGTWVPGADPIIFETLGKADTCLIAAHGFQQSGKDIRDTFETVFQEQVDYRVVLPTAPLSTCDAVEALAKDYEKKDDQAVGMVANTMAFLANSLLPKSSQPTAINTWCDDVKFASIDEMLSGTSSEFVKSFESGHMKDAIAYIHDLIREQIKNKGIKPEKIIVGGHGQGGFLAARAALSFPDAPLGGLWIIAGFLGGVKVDVAPVQQGLKVLFTHGDLDPIVPLAVAEAQFKQLQDLLPKGSVQFENYAHLDHSMLPDMANGTLPLGGLLLKQMEDLHKLK